MAGKKRLAAKLVLLTTVLSAGCGGAYYYTTGGDWPRVFGGDGDSTAQFVADESPSLPADLDAVASSWAGAATPEQEEDTAVSETPRSADITLARAEASPASPASGSRYAMPAAEPVSLAAAEIEETSSAESSEPSAEPEVVDTAAVNDEPALAESDVEPESTDAEPVTSLARGQNSDGDDLAAKFEAASGPDAGNAALPTEPKSLDVPASTPEIGAAARRAREAFRDEQAATTASPAARRYGGPDAASAAPSPESKAGGVPSPALANPFAAQPMPAPVAPSSTTKPQTLTDTLPAENDDSLNPAPAEIDTQLPTEPVRSARATLGSGTNDYRGGEPLQPLEGTPTPLPGGTNSYDAGDGAAADDIDGTGKPGERALEGQQKPALAIQKIAPPEIQVGKPAKFIVQVRNLGSQAAEDVIIRDEVPAGTRLMGTSPTAESNGSQLIWKLGKLSVGEERIVEMQLMPTTEGEVGSVATVAYAAQASAKSRCTMPQLAIRMTAPSEVMIGSEQRVKIELRNPGTGDATGVMLFENVPQNVKHAAGPALEFEIGTLRAGETRELELVLTAEKAGKVINVLSARADGNLQVQQQVEFEVIAPALSVAVNGPERRYLERPATYEVSVENPGTAVAHDVQLVTKLPKGLQFVRANNLGEYDATTHSVYWSLAELPQGETGTVELVAMPIETGPQTLEVEGRAQQGLSDQTQQQILVEGIAAIMFEVRDLEDPIEVGGETGYEIRVVNQGTKAATNVRVAINLPPGMKVVSAEGETRHTAQSGGIAFEPLAQLAPKADTLYRVKVQGMQAGDQRVTVEVNTDDLGQPIRREESTRVFGDE